MEKFYFRMKDGSQFLQGVVENVPDGTSVEEVASRVETSDGSSWVRLIDEVVGDPDIMIDWDSIDDVVVESCKCKKKCKKCKCEESK